MCTPSFLSKLSFRCEYTLRVCFVDVCCSSFGCVLCAHVPFKFYFKFYFYHHLGGSWNVIYSSIDTVAVLSLVQAAPAAEAVAAAAAASPFTLFEWGPVVIETF